MLPGASSRRLRWSVILAAVVIAWLAFMPAPTAEPVTTIRNNGSSANRVDLVILGDGYTQAELDSGKYANDVENFVQGMFAAEPYLEYRNYFNVHRIDVVSNESGADKPASGIFKDTALDATYFCSSIQRLICVNTTKVNTVLNNSGMTGNLRDTVLVIVNDTEYGGSGGSIAVASINGAVVELVLHELGHSFGFLADEYGGPPPPSCSGTEPSNPNSTRQTNPALVKWNIWVDPGVPLPTPGTTNGVPGYYEGSSYCDTGAYRPTFNSKMRSLNQPFHQINEEAQVKRIYNFVSPIDGSSPAGTVIASGPSQAFSVSVPQPLTHNLDVVWRLDGVVQGGGLNFNASGMGAGSHSVTATISDFTPKVRNDPGQLLNEVRSWTVNVTIPGPTITLHPVDRRIVATTTTTFTAAATGASTPTWQWQITTDGVVWTNLTNVAPYSGVTTATLTITNASTGISGRRYRGVATDINGSTASNSALLTVFAAGANVLTNGDFSGGSTGWSVFEVPDIVWSVVSGVMQFFRASPTSSPSGQAVVYQHSGVSLGPGTPISASFDLGNSSAVRKRLTVVILDSNFSDLHVCTFYLAPGAPMRTYQARTHSNQAWANAAIYFYAASGGSNGGNYLIDNVALRYDPAASTSRTDCVDPTAPLPPGGVAGPNWLGNGDFGTGALAPWGTFGAITWQITGGVFEFFKPASPPGTPAGVILQNTGQPAGLNQILTATFQLGNSSAVRRRVTVLVHDGDFSDLVACTFWLAPSQALSTYSVRMFTTEAWTNATLSVYSATTGSHQWILFDNAVLQTTPAAAALGTECFEPPPGPAPLAAVAGGLPPSREASADHRSLGEGGQPAGRPVAAAAGGLPPSREASAGGQSAGLEALRLRQPDAALLLDLREATGAQLTFASWLRPDTGPGEVQVSLDGVTWQTAALVEPSDDWSRVSLDLSAFAGHLVGVRFVIDGRLPDTWRLAQIVFQIGR